MSRTLTARQLTSAERAFGIGAAWKLRLQAFSGSASAGTGEADVAAQATGTGVLTSPLGMAEIAAEVASGTGQHAHAHHRRQVEQLAAAAVGGAAHPAAPADAAVRLVRLGPRGRRRRHDVYGQAGVVESGPDSYLSWFVGYRGQTGGRGPGDRPHPGGSGRRGGRGVLQGGRLTRCGRRG